MTNAWSFLFDELNMSNQNYWEEDGFSIVGNPGTASPDIINFGGSHLPGGIGDDHITFTTDVPNAKTSNSIKTVSYTHLTLPTILRV